MRVLRFLSVARGALPRVVPLLRDARVPLGLKAAAVGGALLVVSPLDVFGDVPELGFVDDALLLALIASGFVALAGRYAPSADDAFEPAMKRVAPLAVESRL
jgi:uncharacterized membrane protein YkvA (DUF1232 family)